MDELRKVLGYYNDDPEALLDKVNWVEGDLLNYEDVLRVTEGMECVYHCAAILSFDPKKKAMIIRNNIKLTANVVDACIENKVKKLLHVSSIAAVGRSTDGSLSDESLIWSELKSSTGYAISKFHSEMEVWRGIQEGLDAVIVNPSIILGPGFWEHGSSNIFTKIDRGLKFYSLGSTGYVGVWDVVGAMIRLMKSDISGERFILNSENLTYKDLFSKVADALGKPRPKIEASTYLLGIIWRLDWLKSKFPGMGEHVFTRARVRDAFTKLAFSNQKIIDSLGYQFESIDQVIGKIAAYYQQD